MGFIKTHITDPIRHAVVDEIRQQIPVIIKAVVIAIAETVGNTATSGVDKITDAIPGDVDDRIIDPLVARAAEMARRLGLSL
ncbi:Uncharacterised protein [Mycobacteroides abscessus subsp. abscessus]|uniref:hypothetical protein n=1 Tax=Mycobacteroides abscessus TaxID=36809 RepID=UPI000926B598|nr:hypothetical protein [Mycobacteroides abscessus]SHS12950.1 Uncharacterised protein [Mycobacteroides abscessus subsp. abscessus]SHS13466.1 Uncharacterised protein [Mycobacteroides abscessus subsp. abscessus]SHT21734.1 Uncharacterised protein [Mycobacteroides abscessus subsp. abscessus]SHW57836.1 Uncharacterised protein [Mycobacteroides abscessus subsp. abscessus]SIB54577.1 Uncharacterised protein [Mycobacteroides abscessus subsp. abscessus]